MSDAVSFQSLMQRVRAGDHWAAEQVVKRYEPQIRREIRVRLTDARLRRVVDASDICQSVLGNFFVRAALGQFDLKDPPQLLKLLVTMAQNKLTDHARKNRAERRDARRVQSLDTVRGDGQAANDDTPSQIVANAELLEQFRLRLTEEERRLADMRKEGKSWDEIGKELGENAEALRKRLTRAVDRVARALGLEEIRP